MAVKITVGPPVLTINRSSTFMVTDFGGEIDPDQAQGVFADDTRFVSGYRVRINGESWKRVSSATVSYHSARLYLINPDLVAIDGAATISADTIGLRLLRSVDEGIHDVFEVTNYSSSSVKVVLELEIRSDFADLFEVKAGPIRERENLVTQWDARQARLVTSYQNRDFLRRFTYRIIQADQPASYANGRLRF